MKKNLLAKEVFDEVKEILTKQGITLDHGTKVDKGVLEEMIRAIEKAADPTTNIKFQEKILEKYRRGFFDLLDTNPQLKNSSEQLGKLFNKLTEGSPPERANYIKEITNQVIKGEDKISKAEAMEFSHPFFNPSGFNIESLHKMVWDFMEHKDAGIPEEFLNDPRLDINHRMPVGSGYLHRAIYQGAEKAVDQLLKHPAININIENEEGDTPLLAGIFMGIMSHGFHTSSNIIKKLLQHPDINVNAQGFLKSYNIYPLPGRSPLHLLMASGLLLRVSRLTFEKIIDIDVISRDMSEVMEELLNHKDINKTVKDYDGYTPLNLVSATIEELNTLPNDKTSQVYSTQQMIALFQSNLKTLSESIEQETRDKDITYLTNLSISLGRDTIIRDKEPPLLDQATYNLREKIEEQRKRLIKEFSLGNDSKTYKLMDIPADKIVEIINELEKTNDKDIKEVFNSQYILNNAPIELAYKINNIKAWPNYNVLNESHRNEFMEFAKQVPHAKDKYNESLINYLSETPLVKIVQLIEETDKAQDKEIKQMFLDMPWTWSKKVQLKMEHIKNILKSWEVDKELDKPRTPKSISNEEFKEIIQEMRNLIAIEQSKNIGDEVKGHKSITSKEINKEIVPYSIKAQNHADHELARRSNPSNQEPIR